jgi:uncharacterized protein (TIGR03084 family)
VNELLADLTAEQEVLDALVRGLADQDWDRPSAAEGWTNRDTISHLAHIDGEALVAITDPDRFAVVAARAGDAYVRSGLDRGRGLPPQAVLAWWREARGGLTAALAALDPKHRIPWYARPMSARSFATARLMEVWAHGLDVFDGLGVPPVDSDRLRHVALLGCLARGYAYRVNGRTPPRTEVRVDLVLPSGAPWSFGPADAPDRVSGSASDFCRVVTRRLHVARTALAAEGPHAAEWLAIAQAYAGPPGAGRPP